MSELGVIASKFSSNTESLRKFDEALRHLRAKKVVELTPQTAESIRKLLDVIKPISDTISEVLTESIAITERNIVAIMRERHRDWPTYKEDILRLALKLSSVKFSLSDRDLHILDDIADALEAECTDLFNRLGEGR
jgi:hypothetical protein